jgi:hypothetical protein
MRNKKQGRQADRHPEVVEHFLEVEKSEPPVIGALT